MYSVDYLEEMNVDVVEKQGIARVVGNDRNVYFGGEDPDYLKNAINEAIDLAVSYYREKNAEIFLTENQLYDLSLTVVLHHLVWFKNSSLRCIPIIILERTAQALTALNRFQHTDIGNWCQ